MNFFEKISFAVRWLFTKKYKKKFERDADKYAIKKGYGSGLSKFKEESSKTYSKKELKKVMSRGYLISGEIRKR